MPLGGVAARRRSEEPAAAGGLITTVNSAAQVIFSSIHAGVITATGFDAGPDYWGYAGSFGSIANDSFNDGGGNPRVVSSCYHSNFGTLTMGFDQINVPDTDTSFISMEIDGQVFTRASADNYLASNDGGTIWIWFSIAGDVWSGANPDDFEIHV